MPSGPAARVPGAPVVATEVLLGAAAGAADAFTFLTGRVFASVMTGNLVLLGLSASSRDRTLALRAGVSLAGYVVGTMAGARVCRPGPEWAAGARRVLATEVAALAAVSVSRGVAVRTTAAVEVGLLAVTALTMGLQSAMGRAVPVRPRPTTYLTGALTEAVAALAAGRGLVGERGTLAVLAAAVLGSGSEAALVIFVPRVAPALATALVAAALLLAWATPRSAEGAT